MKESLTDILQSYFKKLIPLMLTLLFMFINMIPSHIPLANFLRPDMVLMCLYFWVLYRSDLFGFFCVLILGIVSDNLSGMPYGVNIFTFIVAYLLTLLYGYYMYAKSFFVSWVGFAVVLLISLFCKWMVLCFYHKTYLQVDNIFLTYGMTVFLYPLMARLNIFVQNKYLSFEGEIHE